MSVASKAPSKKIAAPEIVTTEVETAPEAPAVAERPEYEVLEEQMELLKAKIDSKQAAMNAIKQEMTALQSDLDKVIHRRDEIGASITYSQALKDHATFMAKERAARLAAREKLVTTFGPEAASVGLGIAAVDSMFKRKRRR